MVWYGALRVMQEEFYDFIADDVHKEQRLLKDNYLSERKSEWLMKLAVMNTKALMMLIGADMHVRWSLNVIVILQIMRVKSSVTVLLKETLILPTW